MVILNIEMQVRNVFGKPDVSFTCTSASFRTEHCRLYYQCIRKGRTNMGNEKPRPALCDGMSEMSEGLDSKQRLV